MNTPSVAVVAAASGIPIDRAWWPLLDQARSRHGFTEVWHGASGHGDEFAALWARARGLAVEEFPSPVELYRRTKRKASDADPARIVDMLTGRRGYEVDSQDMVTTTERLEGAPKVVLILPEDQHTRRVARQGARFGLAVERLQIEPVVVNRHHYPEGLPEGAIYIGRGTPLGNPFSLPPKGERTPEAARDILGKYEAHIVARLKEHDVAVLRALEDINADSVLVCSCKRPDGSGACHGDVVLKLWRRAQARKRRQCG